MAELSQKCDFSSAVRARGGVSVQVDTYLVGYLTCTYLEALILSSAESTSQASKPNPVCQQQGYTKMLHPPRPAQPPQPCSALPCPALPWSALPCPASIPEPDERTRCPRDQAINSLTLPIHSLRLRGCTWQHGYYLLLHNTTIPSSILHKNGTTPIHIRIRISIYLPILGLVAQCSRDI